MASARVLLTVGHSTLAAERFTALLNGGLVRVVADVRRHPGSRRSPQFGVEALRESLAAVGIDYVGLGAELGGRRRAGEGPTDVDNSAWQHPSFRAYADYMGTDAFERGIERLEAIAVERRTAIMCAEAHPSRCHRRLIADAMTARGWRVYHLLSGRPDPVAHELSPHAVVSGGRVS